MAHFLRDGYVQDSVFVRCRVGGRAVKIFSSSMQSCSNAVYAAAILECNDEEIIDVKHTRIIICLSQLFLYDALERARVMGAEYIYLDDDFNATRMLFRVRKTYLVEHIIKNEIIIIEGITSYILNAPLRCSVQSFAHGRSSCIREKFSNLSIYLGCPSGHFFTHKGYVKESKIIAAAEEDKGFLRKANRIRNKIAKCEQLSAIIPL